MVDEEAILRFFAMRSALGNYRVPLKKFLNEYMGTVRNAGLEETAALENTFRQAVTHARDLLGNSAFRMLRADGQPAESAVNRAVLEAQLLACSWIVPGTGQRNAGRAKQEIVQLFQNEQFTDAVQRATGDRARTLQRLRDTIAALERAGVQVTVPHNLQH